MNTLPFSRSESDNFYCHVKKIYAFLVSSSRESRPIAHSAAVAAAEDNEHAMCFIDFNLDEAKQLGLSVNQNIYLRTIKMS